MALLSVSDQAALQSAIDLLVKSQAVELPLSDDVIARLAPLADSTTFEEFGVSRGEVYEALRDHPITGLITCVIECGADVLTADEEARLREANQLMLLTNAVELPFDATIVEMLGRVAESTGFMTQGEFKAEAEERPISLLLNWALALGTE